MIIINVIIIITIVIMISIMFIMIIKIITIIIIIIIIVVIIITCISPTVRSVLFQLGNELEASMVEQAKHNVTDRYKDADVLTLAWNVMQTNVSIHGKRPI